MELVVFDLDGTLLNSDKKLSDVTINVLNQLKEKGIAYTIATGRTRLSALPCIENHAFPHTQIFKNGVEWWDPIEKKYRHDHFLYRPQVTNVLAEFEAISVTPFVFCLENDGGHTVYYGNLHDDINRKVLEEIDQQPGLTMLPLHTLSDTTQITNISALANKSAVDRLVHKSLQEMNLKAYSGGGVYNKGIYWMDIHHGAICKGTSIDALRREMGLSKIICFGDGDNDLTMFAMADEAYAMENASDLVKASANGVIGHHDRDGVALFLKQRFNLD